MEGFLFLGIKPKKMYFYLNNSKPKKLKNHFLCPLKTALNNIISGCFTIESKLGLVNI